LSAQRPSWNYRKEDGGGIILDMFPHWRYLLDNIFGKVSSVSCLGATHIKKDGRKITNLTIVQQMTQPMQFLSWKTRLSLNLIHPGQPVFNEMICLLYMLMAVMDQRLLDCETVLANPMGTHHVRFGIPMLKAR
jgi:hypothetical protein